MKGIGLATNINQYITSKKAIGFVAKTVLPYSKEYIMNISTNTIMFLKIKGKKEIARKLLAKPTNGGRERFVYTFDDKNCKKKMKVRGYGNGWVPQGMAYSGVVTVQAHLILGAPFVHCCRGGP